MTEQDESRRPSTSSTRMPFIVSSGIEKADSVTRKLIRSHARRGKTRKGIGTTVKNRSTNKKTDIIRAQPGPLKLEEVVETYTPLVPGRIGLNLYFVKFSDNVEPLTLSNMAKVTTVARRVTFPLRAAVGFQGDNERWGSPFGRDAVALHIMAFAVQGFIDKVLRHQDNLNLAAILHFQEGLGLLRERLLGNDNKIKTSDSTMGAVLKLASIACFDGDYETSKKHMEGLRKMVDLRGGLDAFKGKSLLLEMLRCDLGISLLGGSCPVFFVQPSELMPPYPEKLLPIPFDGISSRGDLKQVQITDDGLKMAWSVLKKFCSFIDLGVQTQRTIRPDLIYETMAAVAYRLLHMHFSVKSIDEAVRQGLLAFCYHIFLQWQDMKPHYCNFTAAFKSCILSIECSDGVSSQLMLWLLTIGAVSLFDISEEVWLRDGVKEHIGRCQVKSWRDMQNILKSFMWIAVLDEQPGRDIYNSLFGCKLHTGLC
ncbi:hypothetical protein F4774DRAFT_423764 [Daldinia eschscholtzii]|nr:hypothetical protein F4774DRAFT_423764 [Daldinia eschscholtzii]